MKKKFASLFLVTLIVLGPISRVQASEDVSELKALATELSAMVDYLQRLVGPADGEALSTEELRTVIEASVDWIMAAQTENGSFGYEYLPYEGVYSDDDNIVRQAGTLYSLAEVVRKDQAVRPELNATIEQAIAYLEDLSAGDEYNGQEILCVIKAPGSSSCSLGATSLTLTAVLGYVEAYPEKAEDYDELIEGYKSFIMTTKNPEAGFRQDYRLGEGFRSDAESPFYNGESMLALVRYMRYEDDAKVKAVIDDAFNYLKDKEYETPLYLWIMATLKDMQRLWPNEEYIEYGSDFTQYRLESLEWKHKVDRNYCAVVEGVASSHSLLSGAVPESELASIKKELDFWNVKNAYLQIDSEQPLRLVETSNGLEFMTVADVGLAKGGFLTAESELKQRIDFTQHCLNTYLQTLVDIDNQSLTI